MTTVTAKMAMPGATLVLVFGAATLPGMPHIGAHVSAGRATSIEAEAGSSQAGARHPRLRGAAS